MLNAAAKEICSTSLYRTDIGQMLELRSGSAMLHPTSWLALLAVFGLHICTASPLIAQENSAVVRGVVFDSATGMGLEDVAIHVNQSPIAERTDSLGEFLLTGLSNGEYNLTLATEGYRPEVIWFSVTNLQQDTLNIGALPLSELTESLTGAISGTILDSRSGLPVLASGVSVNGGLAAFSGDSGVFTTGVVEIQPGINTVEFKRIGYEPYEFRLWAVRPHTDFDLEVTMDALPVNLDMIIAEADQTIVVFGALREFYRRRRTGMGYYVTRQNFDEENPLYVTDMLRMIPGILVRPGRFGGNRIMTFGPRSITQACPSPNIYVDGVFLSTQTDSPEYMDTSEELDLLFHPNDIAAIEVYPRPAQVPGRFKTSGAICGVVAVWTRWR